MIWGTCVSAALAAGLSADIENVRPMFADHGVPGVDGVVIEKPGFVRWGALAQYGMKPLVLYDKGVNIGTAVGNRGSLALGLSVSVLDRLAIRASMPLVVANWGSTAPLFTNDGVGVGDLQLGARFAVFDTTRGRRGEDRHSGITLGVRGDLSVPSGTKDAWIGERYARGGFGLLSSARMGPLHVAVDLGYIGRSSLDTDADLLLGGELIANAGARWDVVDKVGVLAVMYAKGGLYPPFAGAGQNVIQVSAGAQLHPASWIDIDVLLGRGVTRGYGADQLRVGVGATFRPPPVNPPPVEVVVNKKPEDPPPPPNVELPELTPEPPPVFEWKEGELARVTGKNIEIRDPIQFEYATSNILPESLPVLAFVADLLETDPDIVHVVIEGHASEEGSYGFNYKLALSRAQAVLERLVVEGVHPDRLSFRSMGEVQPVIGGLGTIEALAPNRRVQFHITRILQPGETALDYPRIPQYPWDGSARPASEDERLGGAVAPPKKAADPQPAPAEPPRPENK